MLVADRIAQLNDQLIANIGAQGVCGSWLALFGYAMQIYFDFSGYSDMAVGLGRLFEIELPQNFDSPYRARDPGEFWRRWHITLSRWLRDYLYIPLGGNRGTSRQVARSLLLTMGLGGLWHGASWGFALWGLYHGALLILHRQHSASWARWPPWLARTITLVLICLGWVFFRADSLEHALDWLLGLFGYRGLGASGASPWLFALVACATAVAIGAPNAYQRPPERYRLALVGGLGLTTAAAVVLMNYSSRFLYFQF